MKVQEIMHRKVEFVDGDTSIVEAAKIMTEKGVECLIVAKNQEVVGIVTERDLLKHAIGNVKETPLKEIMSKKVITVEANALVEEAIDLMKEHHIKKLPVKEQDQIVGILTATDLIAYEDRLIEKLANIFPLERKELVGD